MQRDTLPRNPRASTSDLLTWPELSPTEPSAVISASGHRSRQPSDKIAQVLRAGKVIDEDAEIKKKTCSGHKMKEMGGSGIFAVNAEDTASQANSANLENRTSIRRYQQAKNGISQISFSTEESICPKKPPTSIPEVAKHRELCGTLHEQDTKGKKQTSSAKTKELRGNDIFGPPPETVPRPLVAASRLESKESEDMGEPDRRNVRRSGKVSNPAGGQSNILSGEESGKKTSKKTCDQRFAELTSNIFKGDVPPGSAEKSMSRAKLREITGSDLFADGKAENRGFILGARRPPGGGSSISLV